MHLVGDDNRPRTLFLPIYLGIQLMHACLIALAPQRLGRIVGTAALCGVIASVYGFTTGDAQTNYSFGFTFMTQVFTALLFTWLIDPVHEVRHEHDLVTPGELSFARRVWWALCLLNSPRGIGWSCEVYIATVTLRLSFTDQSLRFQIRLHARVRGSGLSSGRSS